MLHITGMVSLLWFLLKHFVRERALTCSNLIEMEGNLVINCGQSLSVYSCWRIHTVFAPSHLWLLTTCWHKLFRPLLSGVKNRTLQQFVANKSCCLVTWSFCCCKQCLVLLCHSIKKTKHELQQTIADKWGYLLSIWWYIRWLSNCSFTLYCLLQPSW